jgi:hypothetical protein
MFFLLGPLPSEIGLLSGLNYLNLSHSHLSGTLPSSLGNLGNLTALSVDHNHFAGSVSNIFGDGWRFSMNDLSLNNNDLTGTFPANLMNISTMVRLNAFHNAFVGRLPFTQDMDVNMAILDLGSNYFTGTLPTNWSRFHLLQSLYVNNNLLHGPLPPIKVGGDGATASVSLIQLNAANNKLTGTLPNSLWTHVALVGLTLYQNLLTGTISSSISQLTALQNLDLSSNRFNGQLDVAMFGPTFTDLRVLNIADNALQGRLPNFTLPSLQVLSLSANCFSGTLSSLLCEMRSLQYLALDTLSQASACAANLPEALKPILRGTFPKHKILGGIPSCLFEMRNLSVLQLLGNGLTGPIPAVAAISPALVNLTISHNALTGPIPLNIQQSGQFMYLSMENNRLSGTLIPDFAVLNTSNTELYLSDNRLSGNVPSSFYPLKSLKILSGNLFGCGGFLGSDPSALPENDPDQDEYVCGSNELNFVLYLWLTTILMIAGLTTVSVVMIKNYISSKEQLEEAKNAGMIEIEMRESRYTQPTRETTTTTTTLSLRDTSASLASSAVDSAVFRSDTEARRMESRNSLLGSLQTVKSAYRTYMDTYKWYNFKVSEVPNLINTAEFLSAMHKYIKGLALISAIYVILVVFYIGLKSSSSDDDASATSYSTRSVQYGWSMTSVFLDNYLSAIFLLCVIVCSLIGILLALPLTHLESTASKHSSHRERWRSTARYSSMWGLLVSYGLEHIWWPFVAHALNFVVVTVVNSLYVTSVLIVPKKAVVFVQLSMSVFKTVWISAFVPFAVQKLPHNTSTEHFGHLVFMLLVNFIIGPGIASAIANSQCFYSAIFGSEPASSVFSISYTSCDFEVDLSVQQGHLVPSTPLVCTTTVSLKETSVTPPFIYSYQCGSFFLVDYIPVLFYSYLISTVLLPGIRFGMLHCSQRYLRGKLGDRIYEKVIVGSIMDIDGAVKCFRTISGLSVSDATADDDQITKIRNFASTLSKPSLNVDDSTSIHDKPLFNGSLVVARRLLDWVVLMTFGLACPVLAAVVWLSVFIQHATWKLMIGKYLTKVGKNNMYAFLRIERAFVDGMVRGTVGGIRVSIWAISGFWALLFFDMAADQHGHVVGIYVAVYTFIGIPLVSSLVFRARLRYYRNLDVAKPREDGRSDVSNEALHWAIANEVILRSPSVEVNSEFGSSVQSLRDLQDFATSSE